MGAVPIPVQVFTGFLGSGKTTLLNEILSRDLFSNSAVIINEFGEIGLDHLLVEKGDDTIIELSNGCLCCTVRGQLIETLEKVIERKPDRIIIETTGLADPVPVLQALIGAPFLSEKLRFSGLFTVFDALNGMDTAMAHNEAEKQLALADCVIVSKSDLLGKMSSNISDEIAGFIQEHNPSAMVMAKSDFVANLETVLESGFISLEIEPFTPGNHHHHHDLNRHSQAVSCTQLVCEAPIRPAVLDAFLDLLLSAHRDHVLRIKGLANLEGRANPILVQGVCGVMSEHQMLNKWPSEDQRTRLVVFLNRLNPTFVEDLFAGFMNSPGTGIADRQALTANPLSVPGMPKIS